MGLTVPSRSMGQTGAPGTPGSPGAPGRGVTHTDVDGSGNLLVTYTDGSVVNAGHVLGAPGTAGATGRGIASTDIVGGHLVVTYSDGATATLGSIVGPKGDTGATGATGAAGAAGASGAAGSAGRGVQSSVVSGGNLLVTYTDGTTVNAGAVMGPQGVAGQAGATGKGILSSTVNGAGRLIITYTDGSTADAGRVVGNDGAAGATGATGAVGRSVTGSSITNGHLILAFSDGTTADVGQVTGATGASGSSASIATLRRIYMGSVEITSSNGNFDFAGATPAGATEVDIVCVGGGGSGYAGQADGSMPGHGGSPGQVTIRTRRVADVPATVAVTIGAGADASFVQSGFCFAFAGGATSFGSILKALGGPSGRYTSLLEISTGDTAAPGSLPSGRPGRANGRNTNGSSGNLNWDFLAATPSMGPGAGGAGMPFPANNYEGTGGGGAAAVHLPASTVTGGVSSTNGGAIDACPGKSAIDVWGFGSGGAGAFGGNQGFQGGIPGGGGGGGGSSGKGGGGGRGAVRLHFYRYEAP